jgi:YspA, cpYpsA-related SLOG family
MRVLVCGGRDFTDQALLEDRLAGIPAVAVIVEGGALGADRLAREFGQQRGITVETFSADWEKHGRAAGPIRNKRMLNEGNPNLVVAFPGGRRTANMVKQAREAGVRVIELAA